MSFRSLLFVPGARPDRFAKALAAGADAVCIDLEDAVPPEGKAEAREAVLSFLVQRGSGGPVGFRANAMRTLAGLSDLAAYGTAARQGAAGIADFVMLPKVEDAAEVQIAAQALGGETPMWAVVESGAGMANVNAIAQAVGARGGILFGGADYAADLGADLNDWDAMLFARAAIANAAAQSGAATLDVPFLDVKDENGLIAGTRRSRALGYQGRACIHPDQVAPVNAVFTPTPIDIARAQAVIAALAQAKGGAALLDGKLIELPVIRAAQRILQRAGKH